MAVADVVAAYALLSAYVPCVLLRLRPGPARALLAAPAAALCLATPALVPYVSRDRPRGGTGQRGAPLAAPLQARGRAGATAPAARAAVHPTRSREPHPARPSRES